MTYFSYQQGRLYAEQVAVADIAAQYGTPCYIYSRSAIEQRWREFDEACGSYPHHICYAVKANSNLAILNLLARMGSGFDIVSGGELARVLTAGGDPAKVIFSGVGKQEIEIQQALQAGIYCFNVESEAELYRLNQIAGQMGKIAPFALRVNPDVDAKTHPYIATGLQENKFGIEMSGALKLYYQAQSLTNLQPIGVGFHIGSQLQDLTPLVTALDHVLFLYEKLKQHGIYLKHVDIGGGLGIRYQDEHPPSPTAYIQALLPQIQTHGLAIITEPGRAIIGEAGILVTRVEYLKMTKKKNFAIVDAAMNDFIRPALYEAWQDIIPVQIHPTDIADKIYDVVGPVCESGDFLGHDRTLAIQQGDLLAIKTTGAYGFAMSSNYNSRVRACEILVDGYYAHLIRAREEQAELFKNERLLPG